VSLHEADSLIQRELTV